MYAGISDNFIKAQIFLIEISLLFCVHIFANLIFKRSFKDVYFSDLHYFLAHIKQNVLEKSFDIDDFHGFTRKHRPENPFKTTVLNR